MLRLSGLVALFVGALMVVSQAASAQSVDLAAEEAAIRALDTDWVNAVAAKDAAGTAAFYAADGAIMPAGSPAAEGHDAVAAVWQSLFDLPGFALTFEPTLIEVGAAGDMAYDIGTYALDFEGDQGPVHDDGKYVVVWKKEDGVWKVAADIFNSNGAM
jgi:uncharacterized protein (TIGR02246 family)